ncbi:hypothetical protein IFR05_014404 [Cadophora sp. M221]|nr:hypothetical protein IFR05_014404 [Cadophora sp. M221]
MSTTIYPKHHPKYDEEKRKLAYVQNGGSPSDQTLTNHMLVRIIGHSAKVDEEEARKMMSKMYQEKAIRLCQKSGIFVVEDKEMKRMIENYENELPEHRCGFGMECLWPEWPCGWMLELKSGVWMGGMQGEEMKPINLDL